MIQLSSYQNLSCALRESLSRRLQAHPFGELALDYCRVLEAAQPSNFQLRYIVATEHGEPLAVGIFYVIYKLDCADYLPPGARSVFAALKRLHLRPLRMDIAFCEVPNCNLPGLFICSGEPRPDIQREMITFFHKTTKVDALLIKEYASEGADANQAGIVLPFEPNNSMPLGHRSFSEYVRSLPSSSRELLRRNSRKFAGAGGHISINSSSGGNSDFVQHATELRRLYDEVCASHNERGSLAVPIEITEAFFTNLTLIPDNRCYLITATVSSKMAGYFVAIHSGDTFFLKSCGLNYELSTTSAAYFNLFYRAIEFAIEKNIPFINLGPTNSAVKSRLGGRQQPMCYVVEIKNPLLLPLTRLFQRRLRSVTLPAEEPSVAQVRVSQVRAFDG